MSGVIVIFIGCDLNVFTCLILTQYWRYTRKRTQTRSKARKTVKITEAISHSEVDVWCFTVSS